MTDSRDAAIIKAEYADYRRVKGRKVMQIICEVSLEEAAMVHRKLGEPGSHDRQIWVAIALLNDNPEPPKRKEPREQTPSQHCATWCKNPEFQEWLGIDITDARATPSNSADILVKNQLGITSKTELDINPEAAERWRALHSEFLYRAFLR